MNECLTDGDKYFYLLICKILKTKFTLESPLTAPLLFEIIINLFTTNHHKP